MKPSRLAVALAVAVFAHSGVAAASTAAVPPTASIAAVHSAAKHAARHRRGGRVRAAWPHLKSARAPRNRVARWLATQVGPVHTRRKRRTSAVLATAAATSSPLWLVRSFDIPVTDPAYSTLANYSWTYDNALATFAFLSLGLRPEAEQLLDQLSALQRTDGSIEYAFDTKTGAAADHVRAGALAWVALAATAYRRKYDSTRYDGLIAGTLRYLLSLRDASGVVRGGPDVNWVSTQHNLLVIGFLRDLSAQLDKSQTFAGYSKAALDSIQAAIGDALVAKTLVTESPTAAYFTQGVGDTRIPVDVQALGSLVLKLRGDARATTVANTMQARFFMAGRGDRPFIGGDSPDVMWSEGTIEAALALSRLGLSSSAADTAVLGIASTIRSAAAGPIGADRDVVSPTWGEYHTWPASAAASWLLIRVAPDQMLFTH